MLSAAKHQRSEASHAMRHYSLHDHQAGVENQTTNGELAYGAPPLLTFAPNGITIIAPSGPA
jgi:hypothetical protein